MRFVTTLSQQGGEKAMRRVCICLIASFFTFVFSVCADNKKDSLYLFGEYDLIPLNAEIRVEAEKENVFLPQTKKFFLKFKKPVEIDELSACAEYFGDGDVFQILRRNIRRDAFFNPLFYFPVGNRVDLNKIERYLVLSGKVDDAEKRKVVRLLACSMSVGYMFWQHGIAVGAKKSFGNDEKRFSSELIEVLSGLTEDKSPFISLSAVYLKAFLYAALDDRDKALSAIERFDASPVTWRIQKEINALKDCLNNPGHYSNITPPRNINDYNKLSMWQIYELSNSSKLRTRKEKSEKKSNSRKKTDSSSKQIRKGEKSGAVNKNLKKYKIEISCVIGGEQDEYSYKLEIFDFGLYAEEVKKKSRFAFFGRRQITSKDINSWDPNQVGNCKASRDWISVFFEENEHRKIKCSKLLTRIFQAQLLKLDEEARGICLKEMISKKGNEKYVFNLYPLRVTLKMLDTQDGGFLRSRDKWNEMLEAPAQGYSREISFTARELAQISGPFFYLKACGKYAKCRITRTTVSKRRDIGVVWIECIRNEIGERGF